MSIAGSTITITANTLQEVSNLLADQNADGSARKDNATPVANVFKKYKGDEVTITINSGAVVVLAEDEDENPVPAIVNTLILPNYSNVDDTDVNLEFTNAFKTTDAMWYIEDIDNLHGLNITLPNGDMGQLKVTADYSTIKAEAAGTADIELYTDLASKASLTLGKGINATATQYIYGKVVANGATVSALILDKPRTDVWPYMTNAGVATAILNTSNKAVNVKEIVVRGTDVALGYGLSSGQTFANAIAANPLDKVTVKVGAQLSDYEAAAKELVGELNYKGEIAAEVQSWSTYLGATANIKNLKVYSYNNPLTISSTFANCIFTESVGYKYDENINAAKNVEFAQTSDISIVVPAQEDANSYTFTFTDVKFATETTFKVASYGNGFNLTGADGKEIEVTWYYWVTGSEQVLGTYQNTRTGSTRKTLEDWVDNNNGTYSWGRGYNSNTGSVWYAYRNIASKNDITYDADNDVYILTYTQEEMQAKKTLVFTDIPASVRKGQIGGYSYTTEKLKGATDYTNFTVIFAFDNCKYGTKKLAKATVPVMNPNNQNYWPTDADNNKIKVNFRYCIDGEYYKPAQGRTTNDWVLIPADEEEDAE